MSSIQKMAVRSPEFMALIKPLWGIISEPLKADISKYFSNYYHSLASTKFRTEFDRFWRLDQKIKGLPLPQGAKIHDTAASSGITSLNLVQDTLHDKEVHVVSSDQSFKFKLVRINEDVAIFDQNGENIFLRIAGSHVPWGRRSGYNQPFLERFEKGEGVYFDRTDVRVNEYMKRNPQRLSRREVDVLKDDMQPEEFDLVRNMNLIQYLDDTEKEALIRKLGRTVKDGGWLIVGLIKDHYVLWQRRGLQLRPIALNGEDMQEFYKVIDLAQIAGFLRIAQLPLDQGFHRVIDPETQRLVDEWNSADDSKRWKMLELQRLDRTTTLDIHSSSYQEFLMYALLDDDFKKRRRVAELHEFTSTGSIDNIIRLDPIGMSFELLSEHLANPLSSLKYGPPRFSNRSLSWSEEEVRKRAIRNKRMAILIMLFADNTSISSLESIQNAYPNAIQSGFIKRMRDVRVKRDHEIIRAAQKESDLDEKFERLLAAAKKDPDLSVLGEEQSISVGDAFLAEMIRYRYKTKVLKRKEG